MATEAAQRRIELGADAAAADPCSCTAGGTRAGRPRSRVPQSSLTGTLPSTRCVSCLAAAGGTEHLPDLARRRRSTTGWGRRPFARRCRGPSLMCAAMPPSCGARTAASRPARTLRPAASGTGASGSAAAASRDGRGVRARQCGGDAGQRLFGASHRGCGAGELAARRVGRRTGAMARRRVPRFGSRCPARRGESSRPGRASCHPSTLSRPARWLNCSAPTFRRRRHCPATKRAKVNRSGAFGLAIGDAVPMLTESLHTDRYP